MTSFPTRRTKVFISYSHKDAKYLERLHVHLADFERRNLIDFWDDTKILVGENWKEKIKQALAAAKVAVLLISADFLASPFIAEDELPPLLAAADKEGTIIIPVLLSPCVFKYTNLSQYQAVNYLSQPLSKMNRHQREELWVKVVNNIRNSPVAQPGSTTSDEQQSQAPQENSRLNDKEKQTIEQLQQELATLKAIFDQRITTVQMELSQQLAEIHTILIHLSTASKDPQSNYILGRIYRGKGYYDQAIQLLQTALIDTPALPEAHLELGLAYRSRAYSYKPKEAEKSREDLQASVKEIEKALELRPDYEDALQLLAGLYRRMGDYLRTLEYYQKALSVNPDSSYTLGNVATIAWYMGKTREAFESFKHLEEVARRRILTAHSSEPYWDDYDLALAQLAQGKIDEAKESYLKAIHRTPSKVVFDSVLSNLRLLQTGQYVIPGLVDIIQMIEQARDQYS